MVAWIAAGAALLLPLSDAGVAAAAPTPQPQPATKVAAAVKGPAEAADQASARLMARVQNRRIEVTGERTESSTTWANPDGTTTVESYTGPVRARDGNGAWQRIDTTLQESGGTVRPRLAAADIAFSGGGDGKNLAKVRRGAHLLGLSWEGTLPKPQLKGATATYAGAVPGGDLVLTALKEGFAHNVVLRERPQGTPEYRLPIAAGNVKLSTSSDGRLRWQDGKGRAKATAPAPVMWDSSFDQASGGPKHQAAVTVEIEEGKGGKGQVLVLKPSAEFLADPAITYPVIIDPTDSLIGPVTDTWIQYNDYPTSQRGSTELKAGTYDGTANARSFLKFNVSKYAGKHILDTKLRLYSYYSSTCSTSGKGVEVRRITSDWDASAVAWSDQPSTTATGAVAITDAKGYNSSCPAGYNTWDIDAIGQAWADGQPNYGLRLAGVSSTDTYSWRRYRSANFVPGAHDATSEPSLTVQYNTRPGTAVPLSPPAGGATNDTTPQLSGKATDPDGNTVRLTFEIWKSTGASALQSGTSPFVASGSAASWAPATALAAGEYKWRASVSDGTDASAAWSAWQSFTVDTTAPGPTTVASTDFPAEQWSGTPDASGGFSGSFTFTPPASDVAGVQYKVDAGSWSDITTTGTPSTAKLSFPAGAHTVTARTRDKAGNVSGTTAYTFYAGKGAALLSPAYGERPARRTALMAQGSRTDTGVRYQYRQGETEAWRDVPVTDVRVKADGSTPSAWPVAVTNGATPELVWNIADSLPNDGPLDIRAVFSDGTASTSSPHNSVILDRDAGAAPDLPVSLGNVNALTGDFTLNAADTTVFGMSVTRFASSRRPRLGAANQGQATIFGPQWSFGSDLESTGTTWTSIQAISPGLVVLKDNEGAQTGFTATDDGGWRPEPGAEQLSLTRTADGGFVLADVSGVTSTFVAVGGSTTSWQLAGTARAADESPSVLQVSEAVTVSGRTLARPKYLIARTSAVSNDTCKTAPATKGCRVVEYLYAASTTATAGQFGSFAGQVDGIRLWATDPGAGSATATTLASYAYDVDGRLRQVWDPRISPALKTQYDYDDAGRLLKLTLPGTLPWTFAYAKAGGTAVAGEGMLVSASQPALRPGSRTQTDGTATYSFVYEVPLTGGAAPYAMGRTDVAAWAQADTPTDATALFPPDAIPRGHTGGELTSSDYRRATVVYTDASGRWVNEVRPGGHVETTEYDTFGNSVRELTAANRELALGKGPDAQPRLESLDIAGLSTAERAQLLSSTHLYSDDGRREVDAYAPLRLTTVATGLEATATLPAVRDGTEVPGRQHIHQDYDGGRPTDGTAAISNVITKTTTGLQVPGYPETDRRSQSSSYDWSKGMPLRQIEDPGGLNLTRTTTYNAAGRAILATTPLSDGDDAGATVAEYWTAGGTGACAGRPEWADLVCRVSPKDKISDTNGNPDEELTVTTEYDRHGQPAKTTEAANGVTRVTETSYDQAARTSRNVVTGGPGAQVQATTTTYDPVTGSVAAITSDDGGKVSYEYDALGRKVKFTDADGATTATEYDALGRVLRTVSSAPYTTTYEYDTSIEPRGLATKMTDSAAGVFTQVYDGDGNVVQQVLPGGVTMRQIIGPDEEPYSRTYTMQGAAEPFFASTGSTTVHEETTERAGLSLAHQKFDQAGRLVASTTEKQDGSTTCSLRTYTYNANGSPKTEASATSGPGEACPTSATASVTHAYDSAGRIVDPGYAYDALGRLTATPDGLSSAYFANDEVQQQRVGDLRQTWTLDPQGLHRRAVVESNATGTWQSTQTVLSHYDGEEVVWTVDGAGGVTRAVLSPVEDLNGIARIAPDGSVSLELDEVTGDGEIEYVTDSGELLVHDMGDDTTGSLPAQIVAGETAVSPAEVLAQCMGCGATPLGDTDTPTTVETVTPLYSPTGSRRSATDYWLFTADLWAFIYGPKSAPRACQPKGLVWKDDGCSVPKLLRLNSAVVRVYMRAFKPMCARHDFGYRNYRKQHRNTSEAKRHRIDKRFKKDMEKYRCKPMWWLKEKACDGAAWGFYQSVDKFGKPAFYKKW